MHQLAFRHARLDVSSCRIVPKTFNTRVILSSRVTSREKENEKGNELSLFLLRPSFSAPRDRFNKPSSDFSTRLAAVSTRGRGGRSFPTRFFVSLRTIVRNCHSIASPPPPREGFVNEPRAWNETGSAGKEREKERERRRVENVSYRSCARGRSLIIRWLKAR